MLNCLCAVYMTVSQQAKMCSLKQLMDKIQALMCISSISSLHTHAQLFYGSLDFVRDNSGEPVPEETFTYSQLSWSSILPYLLPPSLVIHGILCILEAL